MWTSTPSCTCPACQGELRAASEGMGVGGTVCVCSQEPLITFCHPAERDNWGDSLLLHPSRAGIQISLTSTFCLLGVSQVSPSVGEARLFLGEAGHLWASLSIASHFQWPRFSSRLFCQDSQYVFQEPIIDIYCYICCCYTASSRAQTSHQLSEQCQLPCCLLLLLFEKHF